MATIGSSMVAHVPEPGASDVATEDEAGDFKSLEAPCSVWDGLRSVG